MTGALTDRDRASVAAIGKLRFADIAFRSGDGRYLIDEAGRRVLDLTSGCCAASLGYGHPRLVEAVTDAIRTMPGAGNVALPNPYAIALAEGCSSGPRDTASDASGSDTQPRTPPRLRLRPSKLLPGGRA